MSTEFETIPAEENALLEKPKTGLRRVVVAAAALSFVLGVVAATAVGSTSTPGAMDLHSTKISDAHISLVHSKGKKCLTATANMQHLVLADCGTGTGKGHHSKQRFNYQYKFGSGHASSGRIELRDHQDSGGLSTLSLDMWGCWDTTTKCQALLWWPESDSKSENGENVHWDQTSKQIKVPNSNGEYLCLMVQSNQEITWNTCHDGYNTQQWQIGDAPSPHPSGGACNHPCPSGKDSECSWFGGAANSCTKCDTTPGTRFTCVAP
ncbi:unnamed protein product [Pelagomonas calceolata]|uniref:Uncharacterized protein n=2 Tax=Pelagomonas calceolata TaxID=35677 RepID=A0A8J2X6E6_9STRA|nr:unnamed protein product [Pelagomonas calceolata]